MVFATIGSVNSNGSVFLVLAEDRKQIARDVRFSAKKEKKKVKSDAKKARKENAIQHRRMVRSLPLFPPSNICALLFNCLSLGMGWLTRRASRRHEIARNIPKTTIATSNAQSTWNATRSVTMPYTKRNEWLVDTI